MSLAVTTEIVFTELMGTFHICKQARVDMNQTQITEDVYTDITPLSSRVDAMNELAWHLRYEKMDLSALLSQRAIDVALSEEIGPQPYLAGLATSLTIRGHVHKRQNNLDEALQDLQQALELLDNLPTLRATSEACCNMGKVLFLMGDFTNARHYALRAIQSAHDFSDQQQLALALDLMALLECKAGEYAKSLERHEEALKLVGTIGIIEIDVVFNNNLANSLNEMGRPKEALHYAEKALELARQQKLVTQEILIQTTIANILGKLPDYTLADKNLRCAEMTYQHKKLNSPRTLMHILQGRANLCMELKKFRQAKSYLLQELDLAVEINLKYNQMLCHQQLSAIYERMNLNSRALEHYKEFHNLEVELLGAENARKISLLNARQEKKLDRQAANNYHLNNLDLLQAVEERKKVESLLAELAIRDPQTGVFNPEHFYLLAEQESERARQLGSQQCVLLLAINQLKQVTNRHGQKLEDIILVSVSEALRKELQKKDVLGRFGENEFIALLSETRQAAALQIVERLQKTISALQFKTPEGEITVTTSVGVTEFCPMSEASLDDLIGQAYIALFIARRSDLNQVECYHEQV